MVEGIKHLNRGPLPTDSTEMPRVESDTRPREAGPGEPGVNHVALVGRRRLRKLWQARRRGARQEKFSAVSSFHTPLL